MEDSTSQDVIITVRLLKIGKEIGGIIGKAGSNIAKFRAESKARITISNEQSGPERIVTITGSQEQIHKAFDLITEKMHTDINSGLATSATNTVPVTIRLIVPASQCGSIIGKGGAKIKEIRDTTGCAIQVQSEMLPNCSERTVTLSGAPSAILHCIDMLCDVMIQFPAKTATVPFKPDRGNQPYHQPNPYAQQQMQYHNNYPQQEMRNMPPNQGNRGQYMMEQMDEGNEMAHSSMGAGPGVANFPIHIMNWNTQEVTVGNDVMGSIIGKGGSRIKEIRTISGAQIWINKVENEEDKKLADDVERKITIQGTPEAITLAHYLINLSVSMYGGDAGSLLGQPPANNTYGNMGYMGQGGPMNDFNSAMMSAKHALLTSSNYRAPKMRHRMGSNNSKSDAPQGDAIEEADMSGNTSPNGKERRKNKREKFQPY